MRTMRRASLLAFIGVWFPSIGVYAQESVTVTYGGPVYIPDDPAEITMILPIFVNRALDITDVEVAFNIGHPDIGDLKLSLISPTGRTRILADENCRGVRDMVDVTFDTDAAQRYGDACPPGVKVLRPREEIDNWNGDNSIGIWTVTVKDSSDGDVGFLLDYTLKITGTRWPDPVFTSESVVDGASLRRGPATPGELVWIVGFNIGPADSVSAAIDPTTGLLPTELGGSSVSFGGVPAPILFTSLRAIRVQVPPTLTGYSTPAQVRFQGMSTSEIPINLVPTSPGLYTTGQSGIGQISAINADGTVNGEENPAERNSIVVLYANGLGPVNPPVPSGQAAPIMGPLSTAVFPVGASIGGLAAPVYFAGLAPGMVATFQLNVGIPADAPTGNSVPVSITSNGAPSQDLVSISIE